jgi:hypothetical protein
MMNVENPLAYSFILQDDIYLLPADKQVLQKIAHPAAGAVVVKQTPGAVFKYLGGHKKHYLIITHYPDSDFIAGPHLAALESTLKRLGVELDETAIFNLAYYPEAQYQQIIDFFKPQKMLILGNYALPSVMHKVDQNVPQPVGNIRTLLTFSFNEMMDSMENKKTFWEAMKIF